jgi:hypothetical protein
MNSRETGERIAARLREAGQCAGEPLSCFNRSVHPNDQGDDS